MPVESYSDRMRKAKTMRDLTNVFNDMAGDFKAGKSAPSDALQFFDERISATIPDDATETKIAAAEMLAASKHSFALKMVAEMRTKTGKEAYAVSKAIGTLLEQRRDANMRAREDEETAVKRLKENISQRDENVRSVSAEALGHVHPQKGKDVLKELVTLALYDGPSSPARYSAAVSAAKLVKKKGLTKEEVLEKLKSTLDNTRSGIDQAEKNHRKFIETFQRQLR